MKQTDLRPGEEVKVLDTSNGRDLQGFVRRQMQQGKIEIYITRFKNTMVFDDQGNTTLGRFKLKP